MIPMHDDGIVNQQITGFYLFIDRQNKILMLRFYHSFVYSVFYKYLILFPSRKLVVFLQ